MCRSRVERKKYILIALIYVPSSDSRNVETNPPSFIFVLLFSFWFNLASLFSVSLIAQLHTQSITIKDSRKGEKRS